METQELIKHVIINGRNLKTPEILAQIKKQIPSFDNLNDELRTNILQKIRAKEQQKELAHRAVNEKPIDLSQPPRILNNYELAQLGITIPTSTPQKSFWAKAKNMFKSSDSSELNNPVPKAPSSPELNNPVPKAPSSPELLDTIS